LGFSRKPCRLWRPNRRVFLWRDFQSENRAMALPLGDALSREAACLSPRGNHDATIHSQERFAGIAAFPAFPPNPAAPLHLKPASATCGAKLLLRKVPQYMGHNAVCQVGCHTFLQSGASHLFAKIKFGLNPSVLITVRTMWRRIFRAQSPRSWARARKRALLNWCHIQFLKASRLSGIGEFVQLGQNRGAKILERREQV
jgi:hypothetical protein